MIEEQQKVVTALFPSLPEARDAVQALRAEGISDRHISILASGKVYPERVYRKLDDFYTTDGEVEARRSREAGAAIGGMGGFLLGLATITIPELGLLLIVGGTLLTTLTAAAMGGAAGGTFGALMEIGLPEKQIESFKVELGRGKTLVTVNPPKAQIKLARKLLGEERPLVIDSPSLPAPSARRSTAANLG